MATDTVSSYLTLLAADIGFYGSITIICIGIIGCIGNFLTFTSIKLRKSPCSIYFLGASIFELLTLGFGALTRLLNNHFGYTAHHYLVVYCKTRQYLIILFPSIATCFIVLAAFDRFASTSPKSFCRSFATMKRAKWLVSFALTVCALSYIHYAIFADLKPTCSLQPETYRRFTVGFSIFWTSLLPHFLMILFGLGTHMHIKRIRNQVFPVNNNQRRRNQHRETNLIAMMLFQVGLSSILICTRVAYYSYNMITMYSEKNTYESALDGFFSQLTSQLFYLNYAKSFYVYTLSSRYFRRIFTERIKCLLNFLNVNRFNIFPCQRPQGN